MGIAGVEPHQLAPTVGTTGSGSTDSPAPSPTIAINIAIDTIINTVIDSAPTANIKIDIDTAIDTTIGIAVPAIIDTIPLETKVDIAKSTTIDTASPSVVDHTLAATIIDATSSPASAVSSVTGGFDMAFELFDFHVGNDGVAELISVSDSTLLAAAPSTSPAIEGDPSTTMPLAPSEEEPRLETSTP
jgi:hypothetical protein